jgi:hypothetical protein
MAQHYKQSKKHHYVYYCVQGTRDLEERNRQVGRLGLLHNLSEEQFAELNEMLAHLDERRREKDRIRQIRASMTPVEYAVANPTRANLIALRSGRDDFTKMGLATLRQMVGRCLEIETADLSDSAKAAAYRWVLRGLPRSLAVQKIKYHERIAERRYVPDDSELNEQIKEQIGEEAAERRGSQRVRQGQPVGERGEIATYLAGAKFHDTSKAFVGEVELQWEPNNPHDPNAIKILQGGVPLGYVPKNIASVVRPGSTARLLAIGYPWTLVIKQSHGIFSEPFHFLDL